MSQFKLADRVVVYAPHRYTATIHHMHVLETGADGTQYWLWKLKLDDGRTITVHPKQCRKLVKKERRRVWIGKHNIDRLLGANPLGWEKIPVSAHEHTGIEHIEFIEVRKRKP